MRITIAAGHHFWRSCLGSEHRRRHRAPTGPQWATKQVFPELEDLGLHSALSALCTEFTTLIVQRHLEERARGLSPRAAVDEAAARTGRAFLVSAAAAVIGILVLAFSSLPLLRE